MKVLRSELSAREESMVNLRRVEMKVVACPVVVIIGLPDYGHPMWGWVEELLGAKPPQNPDARKESFSLKMVWLKQRMQHIPPDADPNTLRQYARLSGMPQTSRDHQAGKLLACQYRLNRCRVEDFDVVVSVDAIWIRRPSFPLTRVDMIWSRDSDLAVSRPDCVLQPGSHAPCGPEDKTAQSRSADTCGSCERRCIPETTSGGPDIAPPEHGMRAGCDTRRTRLLFRSSQSQTSIATGSIWIGGVGHVGANSCRKTARPNVPLPSDALARKRRRGGRAGGTGRAGSKGGAVRWAKDSGEASTSQAGPSTSQAGASPQRESSHRERYEDEFEVERLFNQFESLDDSPVRSSLAHPPLPPQPLWMGRLRLHGSSSPRLGSRISGM
ncbi:hypothetical protein PIB30_068159 [Stylosanthes scabra]|uniref:Uncharacterized protein n=1 Tax=Stylosanthes scabra TaxID=79078 RepID=A0ABU6URG7_9FABA|nr:hypothetical protein [Stylosanthes scabra]